MNADLDRGSFLEVAHMLAPSERRWEHGRLLDAARESELPHTGWPLGLVLQGEGRPTPMASGIRARIAHYGRELWDDYWELDVTGEFYLLRRFEEDDEPDPSGERSARRLWFDVRVWRIAEALLHSAVLYGALGIPEDEPYDVAVNHLGLAGRELGVSQRQIFFRGGRSTDVENAEWSGQVTQAQVHASLPELVQAITTPLFALFDFAHFETAIGAQVERFLASRLR